MTEKTMALLDTDASVNEAVDKLGKESDEAFSWSLVHFDDQTGGIVPMQSYSSTPTWSALPIDGGLTQEDLPIQQLVEEYGISDQEARYFAQGINHGGVLVIVEGPAESSDRIQQLLSRAGGQGITTISDRMIVG